MKKALKILVALVLMLTTIAGMTTIAIPKNGMHFGLVANAETSGTCGINGDNLEWKFEDGTLTISGTGDMCNWCDYTIPWLSIRESIKSVNISSGVTSIGGYAFYGCGYITSIEIPPNVTNIGENAFACTALTTLDIPNKVTSIGNDAFGSCTSLKSIKIPDSVTSIGAGAFCGCSSLKAIKIPVGVTSIGGFTFENCTSLINIEIPAGVTTIGGWAFGYCTSLESINIPSGVNSIGEGAFFGCTSLTSITIPSGVTSISGYMFQDCTSLSNSVTIPDSVIDIGEWAFASCTSLPCITIGNGVSSIGIGAFDNCQNLSDVYYSGERHNWNSINIHIYFNSSLTNAKIHCSDDVPDPTPDDPEPTPSTKYIQIEVRDAVTGKLVPESSIYFKSNNISGGEAFFSLDDGTIGIADWAFPLTKLRANGLGTYQPVIISEQINEPTSGKIVLYICKREDAANTVSTVLLYGPEEMTIGETSQLSVNIFPSSYYNREVMWSSSNPAVATVSASGVVTGVSGGTAIITVTSKVNGISDSICINVAARITNGHRHFEDSVDRFSFSHSYDSFNEKHAVEYKYLIRYFITPQIGAKALKAANEDWHGSCYGMTLTAILNTYRDRFSLDNFQNGKIHLSELSSPRGEKGVESLINYYHIMQNLPEPLAAQDDLASSSTEHVVQELIDAGKKAEYENIYSLVGITYLENNVKYGHAVAVIGMEKKSSDCILLKIYDPNISTVCNWAVFLKNSGNNELRKFWDVEGQGAAVSALWYIDQSTGRLIHHVDQDETTRNAMNVCCVISDLDILDNINIEGRDLRISNTSYNVEKQIIAYNDAQFVVCDGDTIYSTNDKEGPLSLQNARVSFDNCVKGRVEYTYDLELENITITPLNDAATEFTILTDEGIYANVSSDGITSVTLEDDGTLSVETDGSGYEASLASNALEDVTEWDTIEVISDTGSSATIIPTEEGFVVDGDVGDSVVYCSNVEQKETVILPSDTEGALVSGDGENIVVKEDNDLDGEYETVVSDESLTAVQWLSLEETDFELQPGETASITPVFTPTDAVNKKVTYSSSDSAVATVDEYGTITAVGIGIADISAVTEDGGYRASCKVVVPCEAESIDISENSVTLNVDETAQLSAAVTPVNTTDSVTWFTEDYNVIALDNEGNITAIAPGTATVTVSAGVYSATCEVTVLSPATGIDICYDETDIVVGQKNTLQYVVLPLDNTDNPNVEWMSSDSSIVSVENGVITGIAEGTATITASAGNLSATCKVHCYDTTATDVAKIQLSIGDTYQLLEDNDEATGEFVESKWVSSDQSVAVVDNNGLITAVGNGSCEVGINSKTFFYKTKVEVSALITGIEIVSLPTKLTYTVGDIFDATGMKVNVVYSDESSEEITGYTVTGFDSSAAGTVTITVTYGDFTDSFDVTINERTYSIAYDANGGSNAPAAQAKTHGADMYITADKPVWEGHTFTGWNTQADGQGTAYVSGAAYAENAEVTLYAQWTINTFTVAYDANGGTNAPSAQTKTYGSDLTLTSAEPSRDGYTFIDWNTQADGTGTAYAAGSSYTENAAVTLYAQWSINTFTVAYDANEGTNAPSAQTKTYGEALTLTSAEPTRDGYTFSGWNTQADGMGTAYAAGAEYTANENTTLFAQWAEIPVIPDTYEISYNANGGTGAPDAQTKTEDVALALSTTEPARTGYTFIGWNTQADGSGSSYASGGSYTENAAITLYAQWKINTYTVSYDANKGENAPSQQIKTYGASLELTSAVPTRTGYSFTGWNTKADGSGDKYVSGSSYTANNPVVLYAQWSINSYQITFNANGGSGALEPQTKVYNTALTLSSIVPTMEGYAFTGWNTQADGKGKAYAPGASFTANDKATLYAQWEVMNYTISFDANNGTNAPAAQTKIYGKDLTLTTAVPIRDGYTFTGWNTQADGKGKAYAPGASFTANDKATLYAQWNKNTTTSTTESTTASTTKSTTKSTTASTTKSTTKATTAPTTKSTTKATTASTTKSTTKATTAPTTKSTTKATTASTTKSTTNPTTTKSTTKPTTAPTTKPTTAPIGVQLKRLAGDGRQQTAALISKEAYSTADNVFIASGDNAADALAGVPLASAMNAPILLIRPAAGLDKDTKAEIQRLKAKNVYILGGEGAIPAKVEKDIQALGCKTTRIAGNDRFGTAVEIANKLKSIKGSPKEVFFVYSHNYPDALAVSGVAAAKGAPILYVYSDGDIRSGKDFMSSSKTITKAYIIGGYAAIDKAADTNIGKYASVQRVFGNNRYLTCGEINKTFAGTLSGNAVCIATGTNFPDALAGGVLAAKTKSPMLLVGTSLLDYQSAYVKAKKPNTIYVFGGTNAVSDKIANDAVKAAK